LPLGTVVQFIETSRKRESGDSSHKSHSGHMGRMSSLGLLYALVLQA